VSGPTTHRGCPTAEVRRVELTAEEQRVAMSRLPVARLRDLGLLAAAVSLVLLSLAWDEGDGWAIRALTLSAAGVVGLAFLGGWLPWRRKVTRREKDVIRGPVTRKQRTRGKSPAFTLFVGDLDVAVERSDWRRVRVGDELEVHRAAGVDKAFAVYRHRPPVTD
jgi:hypothetical protein